MRRLMAAFLIVFAVEHGFAQATSLSKNAAAVQLKVNHLAPNARISVVPFHGREEFGTFLSSDQDGFTFYDVDRQSNVSLRFDDVRKVKVGYGGYNSLRQTHTDHTKAIVVVLLVTGILVGVVVAAAISK